MSPHRRIGPIAALAAVALLLVAACGDGSGDGSASPPTDAATTAPPSSGDDTNPPAGLPTPSTPDDTGTDTDNTDGPVPDPVYYDTLSPGSALPDGDRCAAEIADQPSAEVVADNAALNGTAIEATSFAPIGDVPPVRAEGALVDIDGADDSWNAELAPRITGDFTGTTEEILRWGACKWGFDEDLTRARAFTESTWRADRQGDESDDPTECSLIELAAPCMQSFGLLQVKSTVHTGTYPAVIESSAFGVDYAMAWLRACYEGSFTWLGDAYGPGDELGCVGAWFSGELWDQPANDYVGEVRFHLAERSWEQLSS